jgi:hypothetical protein
MINNLLFVVLVILVIAFTHLWMKGHQEKVMDYIRHEIEKQGGRDVQVKVIADNDRDTWTFSVSYMNSQGVHYQTICKTRTNTHSNYHYTLYWRDELHLLAQPQTSSSRKAWLVDELTAENQRLQAKLSHPSSNTMIASSKEQIISDLTAENQRLLSELEKLQQVVSDL